MTDQQPYQTPSNTEWREERRAARRDAAPWTGGLILILIGVILLLQNAKLLTLDNWWALFILIPAVSSFANGLAAYRQAGMLTTHARGSLIGAFFLTVLAFVFLFGISSPYLWPGLLILGGLSLLANSLFPARPD